MNLCYFFIYTNNSSLDLYICISFLISIQVLHGLLHSCRHIKSSLIGEKNLPLTDRINVSVLILNLHSYMAYSSSSEDFDWLRWILTGEK